MTGKLIPVYKDGKLFSVKSDKVIPIYKNGHGIYEVIAELQKGARELEKQEKEKLRSGEIGKRDLLLAE